jgi:hypothetical protein
MMVLPDRDEYSEGVVDKKVKTRVPNLNAAILKLMESDVWTDDKLAKHSPKFSLIFNRLHPSRKKYGLQHIQDSRREPV